MILFSKKNFFEGKGKRIHVISEIRDNEQSCDEMTDRLEYLDCCSKLDFVATVFLGDVNESREQKLSLISSWGLEPTCLH